MVETTVLTAKELIEAIKNTYVDENDCIIRFYRSLRSLKDDIKANVSNDLYDKFIVEYRCVYYEHLYGDGQYTNYVINDCIKVLDVIIDTLIFKED